MVIKLFKAVSALYCDEIQRRQYSSLIEVHLLNFSIRVRKRCQNHTIGLPSTIQLKLIHTLTYIRKITPPSHIKMQ